MLNQKQKGNLTEIKCMTAFLEAGYNVSIPYGDSCRYDLIVDINGKLIRVQVKTASLKDESGNAISFSCRSTHVTSSGVKNVRYSENEIDFFATFWDNQCYLIPISECSAEKVLRFVPPKNGQKQGICFASDYILSKQIDKIKEASN